MLLLTDPAFSQTASKTIVQDSSKVEYRSFSEADLQSFRDDQAFAYHRNVAKTPTLWDRFKRWLFERLLETIFSPKAQPFIKILAYGAVFGLLLFIVAKLLNKDIKGLFYTTAETRLSIKEIDENQGAESLDAMIAAAVEVKQHRRAVRLYYLKTLQLLGKSGLIVWKPEKTNVDYLREVKNVDLRERFANITRLFEYTWYGGFQLQEEKFQQTEHAFREFHQYLEPGA